jgi:hypothetical protein
MCLAVASQAIGDTVTYSTTGTFSGPDLSGGNLVKGGTTLSFTPTAPTNVNGPFNIIDLGMFHLGSTTNLPLSDTFSAGDLFTLTITQTAPPPPGVQSTDYTVTGTVAIGAGGAALTIAFAEPTTFVINGKTYILSSSYLISQPTTTTNPQTTTINGTLINPTGETFAPTPTAAFGGIALLGLMPAGSLLRRRRAAA